MQGCNPVKNLRNAVVPLGRKESALCKCGCLLIAGGHLGFGYPCNVYSTFHQCYALNISSIQQNCTSCLFFFLKRTSNFIFQLLFAFTIILYHFKCTAQWLDNHILCSVPPTPICPVPTWHCTQLLQYYWLYSLCCTLHPQNHL